MRSPPLLLLLALVLVLLSMSARAADENPVLELWKQMKKALSTERDEALAAAAAREANLLERLQILQADAEQLALSLDTCLSSDLRKENWNLTNKVQALNSAIVARNEEISKLIMRLKEAIDLVESGQDRIHMLEGELRVCLDNASDATLNLNKHKAFVALASRNLKSKNSNVLSVNGNYPVLVGFTVVDWPETTLHRYFDSEKNATEFLTAINAHLWEIRNVCDPLLACEQLPYSYSYDSESQRRTFSVDLETARHQLCKSDAPFVFSDED